MAHQVEVTQTKQLSDGAIAVCIRCCDMDMSDSWHTIYTSGKTQEDIQSEVDARMADVAALHDATEMASSVAQSLVGVTKTI